jgi:putative salt-induced outer membrane protein YdiY
VKTKMSRIQFIIIKAVWICIFTFICFGSTINAGAEDSAWDNFVPPPDDKFDWLQLNSGEWLKGEFKVLYDFQVEFDSDELDLLFFDLEDVKQLRTYKAQSTRIEDATISDDPIIIEGIVTMIDDRVMISVGDETREFKRSQLVSIAHSDQKERDLWSGSISLGANIREGNTETVDVNLMANVKRRTSESRLVLDYIGNYSETSNTETSNNHRLSGFRDSFISKKFFWRQFIADYYRDRFKNIDTQLSLATALGYHIIHTSKTEWDVVAGGGVRYTKFSSVEPGQSSDDTSPAFGAGTRYDTELTSWLDFLVDYSFQLVNERSGTYTHYFITTLSNDLVGDVDLDISFVWDRIEDPQPDSEGTVPEQDDYQLIVGISYDF